MSKSESQHTDLLKKQCPEGKCLLMKIYPKSNAGLACDSECYLTHDDNKRSKFWSAYYKRKWKEFFGDEK